jgi:hypothetical protein
MQAARSTRIRALTALGVAVCGSLVAATPARGGSYRVAICNPDLGARHADALFERSSPHYVSDAQCGVGGGGLSVGHDADSTRADAWGAWTLTAPSGSTFESLAVTAAGRSEDGHVPELLTGGLDGELDPFASPSEGSRRYRWSGPSIEAFSARLRCGRATGCDRGRRASVAVKRITASLVDQAAPTLALDGSLLAAGTRRGVQTVAPFAADLGGGVRHFLLEVNGDPLSARTLPCRLADTIALRLRPCPSQAAASFAAATASAPFRQGPNEVRVCVADYAVTTAANRTCAERGLRVDNLCPISEVATGWELRADMRRTERGGALVAGRLLDAAGGGVDGARVCVGSRVRIVGSAERVVATPLTGAAGRFKARIPAGPSRQVRIAYWPDGARAVERYLELRVRARPRLRLRPTHRISNGNRVRFEVRLPGPGRAHRRVRVQVRSGKRWLELRGGLTGARGIYRARYRFHATTGRRTYAFRAVVPKQDGYPYEPGRSRVARATVVG